MLDDLFTYDDQRMKSIRRLRVKGYPFPVYASSTSSSFFTHFFGTVIAMFPGLQLDLLVVENCYLEENDGWGSSGTYCEIGCLLNTDGWKELHYLSPTTEFITDDRERRDDFSPQPEKWQSELRKRDEQAVVEMFVSEERDVKDAAYNANARTKYAFPGENMPVEPPKKSPPTDVDSRDQAVDNREVLVVMNRGPSAHYIQNGENLNEDVKKLLKEMSWPELRDSDLYVDGEDDPCAKL